MPQLSLEVGDSRFLPMEVPDGCTTVGRWKELVEQGELLGESVLYATKLSCRVCTAVTGPPAPVATGVELGNSEVLPVAMRVEGPRSVVDMLEMTLRKRLGMLRPVKEVTPAPPPVRRPGQQTWPWLGDFRVGKEIGHGFEGPCVYEAEPRGGGERVAVKWPTTWDEVKALRQLSARLPPNFLGLPRMLGTGTFKCRPWIATELLRAPLTEVFPRLRWRPLDQRWLVIRVLGRMLLRRLETLHRCGLVHCDVSPENVLLGRAGDMRVSPQLVDFGLARPYPDGGPLPGDQGSIEWSSIRSAEGGERRPQDDLEALGWMLATGVIGQLGWFTRLGHAYPCWHIREVRDQAVRYAQAAKRQFLREGLDAVAKGCSEWANLPADLYAFLSACQKEGERPDYVTLAKILGGEVHESAQKAEEEDVKQWNSRVYYPL